MDTSNVPGFNPSHPVDRLVHIQATPPEGSTSPTEFLAVHCELGSVGVNHLRRVIATKEAEGYTLVLQSVDEIKRDVPQREAVYDDQISPLMSQIIALCKEHDIPMVSCFQLDNREPEDRKLHCITAMLEGANVSNSLKGMRKAYRGD